MMRVAVAFFAVLMAVLAPGLAAAGKSHTTRTGAWRVTLAPAPGDLALDELRVPARRRPVITPSNVLVAGQGRFGDDYIAVARVRGTSRGGRVLLVLAVDRVTGAAMPATTSLTLRVPRSLGSPASAVFTDPFTSASGARVSGSGAARCGLTRVGAALGAASLVAIDTRGPALTGLSATDAVAAAYDAVCGLPYPASLKAAVESPSASCIPGVVCCPPTATCAPPPTPPPTPVPTPPSPPGCTPCQPRPGFACPLSTTPSICYARATRRVAEAAGSGAH